jgi:hypothetical protein
MQKKSAQKKSAQKKSAWIAGAGLLGALAPTEGTGLRPPVNHPLYDGKPLCGRGDVVVAAGGGSARRRTL